MPLPPLLQNSLRLPVIGAPMFIVSAPELVLAQCKAGIVGSFPALNARPPSMLDEWLSRITSELDAFRKQNPSLPVAPFAVNQIVHASNDRLEQDLETCVKHRVPIVITSLRPPAEVVGAVQSYGGIVLHDVISVRHAEKALEQGVDGIIAVCAGAGGHAGRLSPFALVKEIRAFYDGTLVLSGAISCGQDVLAARSIGADLAYVGTRFIASTEANALPEYKEMIVASHAADVVYTSLFSGIHGSYLRGSIEKAGLDPDNLPEGDKSRMDFAKAGGSKLKAWRDVWSAGQGVGSVNDVVSVAAIVERMAREYEGARLRLCSP